METLEKLDPEEAKQIDFETVHNIGKFILRMDQISGFYINGVLP